MFQLFHRQAPLQSSLICFFLPHQVTVIGNEICVYSAKFANLWSQIKQM